MGVRGKDTMEWRFVEKLVKRWSAPFNPDDDTFRRIPVIIENYFHKAEFSIVPKLDFGHYRGHMMDTKMKADEYPFIAYWMEQSTFEIETEMEYDQIFTGVQNLAGDDAEDMFDGLLTIISKDQALGSPVLTAVNTGALTEANIVDQFRQVADAVQLRHLPSDMQMMVAPEVYNMYIRKRQALSGFHPLDSNAENTQEIMLDAVNTRIKLCKCNGMTGSQRIILTPKSNVYYAPFGENDMNIWAFEINHRQYDAWCDYRAGVGFLVYDPRVLYINNQA